MNVKIDVNLDHVLNRMSITQARELIFDIIDRVGTAEFLLSVSGEINELLGQYAEDADRTAVSR